MELEIGQLDMHLYFTLLLILALRTVRTTFGPTRDGTEHLMLVIPEFIATNRVNKSPRKL